MNAVDPIVQEQNKLRLRALRTVCRNDVNKFIETVFKNDQVDGSPPFEQQWFHREWQHAWLTERVVVIHGATGFGKTEQLLGHLLWRMGKKPNIRILIVGKTSQKAEELTGKLIRQIEQNKVLQWIFPELKAGAPWGTETARLATAGIDNTTNTLTVYGIATPKAGPRADIVVLDDVNDIENTRTEDRREHVIATVDSVLQSRLTTNGQIFMLANAWHEKDLAFQYSARRGVWYRSYPARYADGAMLWPSFRPETWLKKIEETTHPREFARMYLCKPYSDTDSIFSVEWFNLCRQRGANRRPMLSYRHEFNPDGTLRDISKIGRVHQLIANRLRIVGGVDLATGRNKGRRKSDLASIFIAGVHEESNQRYVLAVARGRWSGPVILGKMKELQERYEPEVFFVEDNGTQLFFQQFAELISPDLNIQGFTTTAEKWSPVLGIQGMAVAIKAGRYTIPDPAPGWICKGGQWQHRSKENPPKGPPPNLRLTPEEIEAIEAIQQWELDMLEFTTQGHTSDLVMSGWFAERGLVQLIGGSGVTEQAPTTYNPRARPGAFDGMVESVDVDGFHNWQDSISLETNEIDFSQATRQISSYDRDIEEDTNNPFAGVPPELLKQFGIVPFT